MVRVKEEMQELFIVGAFFILGWQHGHVSLAFVIQPSCTFPTKCAVHDLTWYAKVSMIICRADFIVQVAGLQQLKMVENKVDKDYHPEEMRPNIHGFIMNHEQTFDKLVV
jgi:hypothetical protein